MKRTLLSSLILFAFSYSSVAQYITAEDNASNYSTWTNGSNEGFGFGAWSVNNDGGAGNYIGPSGLGSSSFGIYSGQTELYDNSVVTRTFSNVLGIGTIFSCNLGYTSVANGGEIGISFFSNSSFRLNLKFIGGGSYWILNDGDLDFNTNIPFDDFETLSLSLQRGSSDNKYIIFISQGANTYNSERIEYTATSGVFNIDRIDIYSKEQGSGNNLGFNNLQIEANNTNILGSGESVIINGNPTLENDLSIQNLTIPSSNSFTISPGKSLTVTSTLTNNAALGIVLQSPSDHGAPGSLRIDGTYTGTGTIKAERYIQAYTSAADGWHLISSPVNNPDISSQTNLEPGEADDFYAWNEVAYEWTNYKPGNVFTNLGNGIGYLVSYQTAATKYFTGTPNNTDVTFSDLSRTLGFGNGWHLVGNPYPSAILWNKTDGGFNLSGIAGIAKMMTNSGAYTDIDPNEVIPAMQGFFVQATSTTNSFTIPLAARIHDNTVSWYKSAENGRFLMIAKDLESNMQQESVVQANEMATEGYDYQFDSQFWAWYAPQFYSIAGDIKLSTNTLPSLPDDAIIPFGFVKNEATQFNITMQEQISGYIVYLNDLLTGVEHNLTDQPVYSFTSAEGDDPNRFLLYFAPVSVNKPVEGNAYGIYSFAGQVYVSNTPSNAQITLSTLTGQVVMQRNAGGSGLVTLNAASLPKGVYIVTVQGEGARVSRKVVL